MVFLLSARQGRPLAHIGMLACALRRAIRLFAKAGR